MAEKVVVGLSGGVDSAVAAYLLKQQGYEVIGVTMQVWQQDMTYKNGKTGIAAVDDAKLVAKQIGIRHEVLNFHQVFRDNVISYFIESYNNGRTPNPCIRCNRSVKWEALLTEANRMGAKYVATGHYANIIKLPNDRYSLSNAKSATKDQTYTLFYLTQDQLSHTIMPLANYEKTEIREIAKEAGIVVADKKDSQDMCFVPDGRYANFIWKETGERAVPGNFVTIDGEVIGRHKGIIFYTVGQRKGLNLDLGKKTFVKEIRPETNEVVVAGADDMFTRELTANNLNFMGIGENELAAPIRAWAKIRYSHKAAECTLELTGPDTVHCEFDQPQRAITPGQGLVVYSDEGHILFGGEII